MFTIVAGGYHTRHLAPFEISRPQGLNQYVLLLVKSWSECTISGDTFKISPNSALLIERNTPYYYHSIKDEYVDDWLHFICSEDEFPQKNELFFHQPIPLGNSSRVSLYIQQMIWEKNYAHPKYREENMHMLMSVLFNNLVLVCQEEDNVYRHSVYYERFQNLRMNMQTEVYKQYVPTEIAESMGISSSYFQNLYKTFFHVPFQTDLIHMRIDYAKNLIAYTTLKMEQIAKMCGYGNETHFYRQFRKKVGMTPKEYRLLQITMGI